jgi:hypothetical protein
VTPPSPCKHVVGRGKRTVGSSVKGALRRDSFVRLLHKRRAIDPRQ